MGKKMGRPVKIISQTDFEKLCGLQCTKPEICAFLDVTDKTLDKWIKKTYKDSTGKGMLFSQVYEQKRSVGKISLRRSQFRLAETNAAMAIFLGKNYLGQSDNPGLEVNAPVLIFKGEGDIRD